MPLSIHKTLRWSFKDPLPFLFVATDALWQMISKDKKKKVVEDDSEETQTSFVPAKGSIPVMGTCFFFACHPNTWTAC